MLVRASAARFEELLVEVGRALAELLTEDPPGALQEPEPVSLRARDRAALLVAWLNELIYLSETRRRIYSDLTVSSVSEHQLEAKVRGWPAARLRTQVKAAAFHGPTVTRQNDGWAAEVVLDV